MEGNTFKKQCVKKMEKKEEVVVYLNVPRDALEVQVYLIGTIVEVGEDYLILNNDKGSLVRFDAITHISLNR